jgi:hypothetical protein
MCSSGLLWSYGATFAVDALAERPSLLAVVRGHLAWSLDAEAAKLIYTELISNVVRHAPGPARVSLESKTLVK